MERKLPIAIRPEAVRRIKTGHPWIFSNELVKVPRNVAPGELVDIHKRNGEWIGRGYFNPRSLIAVRLLTREPVPIDEAFFEKRIAEAQGHREREFPEEPACRLLFGEADGLPGLIVDRYGPVLAAQFLTAGMDRLTDVILKVLIRRFKPSAVIARNDSSSRALEGLPKEKRWLYGEGPGQVVIKKNGLLFEVDVWGGQKTGFFLDQSENYRRLDHRVAGARVLDAFCYTGAWGLHAARYGAGYVLGMDASAAAIRLAEANAGRNGLQSVCSYIREDVFDGLRRLEASKERFDTVILDPPAFAKSRAKIKEALRGYKEINRLAMRILSPGGTLVTCSCSYHVDRDAFSRVLVEAASDARRSFRVLEWGAQSRDHPVALGIPETEYLKCVVLRSRS